jgi:hypothetical protein
VIWQRARARFWLIMPMLTLRSLTMRCERSAREVLAAGGVSGLPLNGLPDYEADVIY